MRVTIERSFLVRHVQKWELEVDDDTDFDHVLTIHRHALDEDLEANGTLLDERLVFVEDDDLDLRVLDGPQAEVIHLHERRKQ